jgi:polysaccharide pyruvyl transferase WcaK-like protein
MIPCLSLAAEKGNRGEKMRALEEQAEKLDNDIVCRYPNTGGIRDKKRDEGNRGQKIRALAERADELDNNNNNKPRTKDNGKHKGKLDALIAQSEEFTRDREDTGCRYPNTGRIREQKRAELRRKIKNFFCCGCCRNNNGNNEL